MVAALSQGSNDDRLEGGHQRYILRHPDSFRCENTFSITYSDQGLHLHSLYATSMAPIVERAAEHAIHLLTLHRRNLDMSSTQKVTLGIIAVYVVVIAILWNIPYVSKILWPFKVGPPPRSADRR